MGDLVPSKPASSPLSPWPFRVGWGSVCKGCSLHSSLPPGALPLPLTFRKQSLEGLPCPPMTGSVYPKPQQKRSIFHLLRSQGRGQSSGSGGSGFQFQSQPWSARLPVGISLLLGEVLGLVPVPVRPTACGGGHLTQALIPTGGTQGPSWSPRGLESPTHWLCNTPPPSRPLG